MVSNHQGNNDSRKGKRKKPQLSPFPMDEEDYNLKMSFDNEAIDGLDLKQFLESDSSSDEFDRRSMKKSSRVSSGGQSYKIPKTRHKKPVWANSGKAISEEELREMAHSYTDEDLKKSWGRGRNMPYTLPEDPKFYCDDGIHPVLKKCNSSMIAGRKLKGTKEAQDLIFLHEERTTRRRKKEEKEGDDKGVSSKQISKTGKLKPKVGYIPSEEELLELQRRTIRQRNLHQKTLKQ